MIAGQTPTGVGSTDPHGVEQRTLGSRLAPAIILGSIALLPYLLLRGRLVSLQDKIKTTTRGLKQEVKSSSLQIDTMRKEHQRLMELLEETKNNVEALRTLTEQKGNLRAATDARLFEEMRGMRHALERLEAGVAQRDRATEEWERLRRDDLRALIRENEQARTHSSALRDVGTSLADVAAFMHEMELQQGYTPLKNDGRGIERTRRLAKKLQELPSISDTAEIRNTTELDSTPDTKPHNT